MPTTHDLEDDPLLSDSDNLEDPELPEGEEEVSYSDLYNTAFLNGEIIITIPIEEEEKTKAGIKNFKSKNNQKLRDAGQPTDTSLINFATSPSPDFQGCIDLKIIVIKRGTVKIKGKIRIPENDLPD